ncbi:MAG TPA: N-acetylmuramic acid 6-phosphate etherase [Alphaproteobacteria bacterium]|jgi:N-acetylmuramic acid 6-phosphate etherase
MDFNDNAVPPTEASDPRYEGIDQWPADQVLLAILAAQERAVAAVRPAIPAMAAAAEEAAQRLADNPAGRIIYIGAGTPARLGVQDGVELTPTFGWPQARMDFVVAGREKALLQSVEGAEDDVAAAEEQIAALNLTAADVCIAVSASGTTPFTVAACKAARAAGAQTIGISSSDNTPLLQAAAHKIFIDSGAEPVAGSTRMNAGTAQKVALNMLSTLIMMRLGHVFDGMMVDVQLTNEKLRQRAEKMIERIAQCAPDEAAGALERANGKVKLAVLLVKGLTPEQGRERLEQNGGNLRRALEGLNL